MNQLSWLIYGAEVLGNIGALFCILGFAALGATAGGVLIGAIERDNTYSDSDRWQAALDFQKSCLKIGPLFAVIMFSVSCFIPSKETVYAIAASEIGENVLKSDTGSKAVKALDAWLDKQISETKEEEKEK